MTPEVRWFSPDTQIQQVARVMRDEGIGCVPIGENDRLVGMITIATSPAAPWPQASPSTG